LNTLKLFILFRKQHIGCKKGSSGSSVSKSAVENFFNNISVDKFTKLFGAELPIPKNFLEVQKIDCTHVPIFIAGSSNVFLIRIFVVCSSNCQHQLIFYFSKGRYCKFSRKLSQTPWFLNGGRKSETSTEELISKHIIAAVQCENSKFTASGREDVDVRYEYVFLYFFPDYCFKK